jgi:hypothetical protein
MEHVDEICTKSVTDKLHPHRDTFLIESVEAIESASKIESECTLPIIANPFKEHFEPSLLMALILNVEPKLTNSKTEQLAPARVFDLTLIEEPKFTLSNTDKEYKEPKYVKEATESDEPNLAKLLKEIHEPT